MEKKLFDVVMITFKGGQSSWLLVLISLGIVFFLLSCWLIVQFILNDIRERKFFNAALKRNKIEIPEDSLEYNILFFLFMSGEGYATDLGYKIGCSYLKIVEALEELKGKGLVRIKERSYYVKNKLGPEIKIPDLYDVNF